MKVIEHLTKAKEPLISFEIIPPKRGGDIYGILSVLDDIMKYKPPFIDITSHSAEVVYEETPHGIKKRVKRKRPGTLGICALIQNKYDIDAVPHILTKGFTREETEDFLIELNYLGIQNVLAVRGDDSGYEKPIPEGRSANKTDIKFCKEKLDAGADYVVTQMFFDNKVYFKYVELCSKEGITAPIIPGLKILSAKSHLINIPKNFYVSLPDQLVDEVNAAKPEHVLDIGVEWAAKQVEELLNKNVSSVHFYIMQNSAPVKKLMNRLKLFKKIA